MATAERYHTVGQSWHPLKDDERWKITYTYCGYSVPMYCCWFCDTELVAVGRTLGKAEHACEVLREERRSKL
jgi:hypothetical protein